jgi:hypothetical protein
MFNGQDGVSFRYRTIPQVQTAKAVLYYSKLPKKNLVLQIRETAQTTLEGKNDAKYNAHL